MGFYRTALKQDSQPLLSLQSVRAELPARAPRCRPGGGGRAKAQARRWEPAVMRAAGMSLACRGELKLAFLCVGGGCKGFCFSSLRVS